MADDDSNLTLPELRDRQTQLVTAIATETDPSRLAEIQRELEAVARRLEQERAGN